DPTTTQPRALARQSPQRYDAKSGPCRRFTPSRRSNTMRTLCWIVASLSLFALGRPAWSGEPIPLSVLYAGNPGSSREHDFTSVLGKSFKKVGTTDYRALKQDDAKGYDVVILDWTSIYPRDEQGKMKKESTGINSPTPPVLSEAFDKPTILIGAAGSYATRQLSLKIDWL